MLLLAQPWLHNLDPFAIAFDGFVGDLLNGGIRWYGLSYLAGFFIGYLLVRRVLTVGISPLKPAQTADLIVTIAIAIVIGGRLGYVAFYHRDLFFEFTPDSIPWWGVLKINQGGMASHGGMIGGIAGCFFFAWRYKIRAAHLLDLCAFGAPLGLMMGRIANFINGELYGRECLPESPLYPLAVQFPQEIAETWTPDQVAALNAAPVTLDLPPDLNKYQLTDEAVRQVQAGNEAWIAYMAEHLTPRYPSQLFAGLTEGIVVFAVLLLIYRRPVKAGLICGWFCVVYAVMRVINELYRNPDPQFFENGQAPTVTQGQWLSMGLFVVGIVIIFLAKQSKGEKLGGWMRPRNLATDGHG